MEDLGCPILQDLIIQILEIKSCGLGSRIRDMEAEHFCQKVT